MNTPQSDTPISDATPHNVAELGMLCRKLERKLAAANERVKKLEVAADRLNLLLCCEFGYCDTEEWNTSSIAQRCKMVEEASVELDKLIGKVKP